MAWNRLYLKNWVKDIYGLPREKEDGLLTDERIYDAIDDSLKEVAYFLDLLTVERSMALRAGQWQYPVPDDIQDLVEVFYEDSSGTRYELRQIPSDKFMDGRDPEDDTATQPLFYCLPGYQARVYQFYAIAPDTDDYVANSYVTTESIRTIIDSGINFGLTMEGTYINPEDLVHNITDKSSGYVEVLDIDTTKSSGTATGATSTEKLVDSGADFVTDGVAVGDIICTPSTGVVTSYAFVTEVDTTELTYTSMKGDADYFASADLYKVGKATRIRLSAGTPHRGLRDGADNSFDVGSAKATITGTTFTSTTVTGSATSGAETGDTAIASGGSHGQVTEVDDNALTVDKWIGGIPAAGETVSCKECDQYRVESKWMTERVIQIGPTPSSSDTVGSESVYIRGRRNPQTLTEDDDPVEVPERYRPALLRCIHWKTAERMGTFTPADLRKMEMTYKQTAGEFTGDETNKWARNQTISPWLNRRYKGNRYGVRDQGRSGKKWDTSGWF
jgi:hypothetical protein